MLIVGDYEVLTLHFTSQMVGDYSRNSVYIMDKYDCYGMVAQVYDELIEVVIRDISKRTGLCK